MCGKNGQTILVHVYVPKLSQTILKCHSAILIGAFSIEPYSSRKFTKYVYKCTVSIYGAHRRGKESNDDIAFETWGAGNMELHGRQRKSFRPSSASNVTKSLSLPHAIGQFGGTECLDFLHRGLQSETAPTVWISFSGDGSLEEVLLNQQRVPISDVILVEYDPYPLSRCLIMSAQQKLIGIPDILIESFTLVSMIPGPASPEGDQFRRLIPHYEELQKAESCTSINACDFENDPVTEKEGARAFLGSAVKSRSLGIDEFLYKHSLLWKLFRTNCSWVISGNIICLLMVDIVLGTLLTMYLRTLLQNYGDYDKFCKVVLELLLKLLDWLSGAPAGLKLNAELNSLFHSFYSYHLHLWGGYMELMEPFLKILFHGVVHLGYFGLTIQLGMVKDLLSLTTFHVYCLYIYATRLFYIELNTLKSLGRLIMGKKWNPLRHRIDSVTLSLSELFLGAFGFTIALFLLPTIWVYYVVFLVLRIPIVFIELLLKFFIKLFDSLEIATAFLIFTNSPWIGDEAYLHPILPVPGQGPTVLRYEIRTQTTTRGFYKVPSVRKILLDTISKIMESRVITY